jgi:hypothetical protein
MVGLIVYTSGKSASARALASSGLSAERQAGILFGRALAKLSRSFGVKRRLGHSRGSGTYAIGRAAIAFSLKAFPWENRKTVQLSPSWDSFKRRRLPLWLEEKEKGE